METASQCSHSSADSSLIRHLKHVETCGSSECAMVTEHKPERTPRSHATTIVALEMEKNITFFVCFWYALISDVLRSPGIPQAPRRKGRCTNSALANSSPRERRSSDQPPGPWCHGTNMWCNVQQLWCRSHGFLEFFGVEYGGVTSC